MSSFRKFNPNKNDGKGFNLMKNRILIIVAAKLLNHSGQVTESQHPNYWIAAATLLKTATTPWPPAKPKQGKRMVTGQCRPLLQVETGRLMLPERRWKCKWNVTSCSWQAKLGTLRTGKITYLQFLSLFVAYRGRQGNIALFRSWKHSDWCFQLDAGSARCNIANVGAIWTAALYPKQTEYLFPDL